MSNEVVKYHNKLNTVIMRRWSAEEMNFFFAIISKAREQGTKLLVFETDEIKKLIKFTQKDDKRWQEVMRNCAKKVIQLTYFEDDGKKFEVMTLFSRFRVYYDTKTVEVKVSEDFDYILNRLEAQFTRYELEEFTNIRSTYAKTMYRLLKQWRTVGQKGFKIEEFIRLLDMPKTYRPSEIDRLVLKPILSQLSPFFEDLKVKKIKSTKRGNPVLGYEFTWKAEKTESYDPQKYQKKAKTKTKQASNVPSWSQPNYKNTMTEQEKDEIELKKRELLEKMNKSYEEFDFLENKWNKIENEVE